MGSASILSLLGLSLLGDDIEMLAAGAHGDPFRVLGLHPRPRGPGFSVRVMAPDAVRVRVEAEGANLELRDLGHGFFYGAADWLAPGLHYRLRIADAGGERIAEDPYRFGLVISAEDAVDLKAGRCWNAHHILGARPLTLSGVSGLAFAVWAPLARQVAVTGDWNQWDFRARPMRFRHEIGVWEFFEPDLAPGAHYAFDVLAEDGTRLRRRDPMSRALSPVSPGASVATGPAESGRLRRPPSGRASSLLALLDPPDDGRVGLEHLMSRVDFLADSGFTGLWLSQVMEAPAGPGVSGVPIAAMCPAAAWGGATGIAAIIGHAHSRGLNVLMDWPVSVFPLNPHGLAGFDGSSLYENSGSSPAANDDTQTRRYNYARYEVANFLVCALLDAIERFGFDGIAIQDVGEVLRWPASDDRGDARDREVDPAAVDFLRCQNEVLAMRAPGLVRIACDGIGWPGLTQPGSIGGLGFDFSGARHWTGLLGDHVARALALGSLPGPRSFLTFGREPMKHPGSAEIELAFALFLALPGVKAIPAELAGSGRVAAIMQLLAGFGMQGELRVINDPRRGPDNVIAFARGDTWLCAFNPAPAPRDFPCPNGGRWRKSGEFGAKAGEFGDTEDEMVFRPGNSAMLPGRSLTVWENLAGNLPIEFPERVPGRFRG